MRLKNVDLSGVAAHGLSLTDTCVEAGAWSNLDAAQATLARVEARGVRASGADFTEATLNDVLFEDCRIDLALFRFAKLDRVSFRNCRLDESDFYEATLESVVFENSSLVAASLERASLSRCEIRGGDLSDLRGVERLAGSRVTWPEVIQLAALLAEAHGIAVITEDA